MVLIDVLLTPENAWEHGYQWVIDLLPAILQGEIRGIEDFENKQLWKIGKAKIENGVIGFYEPVTKTMTYVKKDLLDFPVDETLDFENANVRGFRWVDDFVYNKSKKMEINLYETMKELVEDGYKIGKAKTPIGNLDKGWYAPLNRNKAV